MKLLCAFAAFAVAAAANPNLILSHEGLEAGLKLDSNGDINVYAADVAGACVDRRNWCGRYKRDDCTAGAPVKSRLVWRSDDGTVSAAARLHADGKLSFSTSNGGHCIDPMGDATDAQNPIETGLRLTRSGGVRANVVLDPATGLVMHRATGGTVKVGGETAHPECSCANGQAHGIGQNSQCQKHQDHHCETCDDGFMLYNKKCVSCPDGFFKNAGTVASHGQQCQAKKTCAKGHFVSAAGSTTEDRTCSPCPSGTYQDQDDSDRTACAPQPSCAAAGTRYSATATAERTCVPCLDHFYQPNTDHKVAQCSEQPTCGKGEKMSVDTKNAKRECSSCGAGTYQDAAQHRETSCISQPTCTLEVTCQVVAPTTSRKRQCVDVDECSASQWMSEKPTLEHNACGVCSAHKGCTDAQYQVAAGTKDEDTKCALKECTQCANGDMATGAACDSHGGSTCAACSTGYYLDGGVCKPHKDCNALGKVQTSAGNGLQDAVCGADKQCVCPEGTRATGTNCPVDGDAKCTACSGAFFIDGIACSPHSVDCNAQGKVVATVATNTADATCGAEKQCVCTNGTGATGTNCPSNGATKCTACDSGYTGTNCQFLQFLPSVEVVSGLTGSGDDNTAYVTCPSTHPTMTSCACDRENCDGAYIQKVSGTDRCHAYNSSGQSGVKARAICVVGTYTTSQVSGSQSGGNDDDQSKVTCPSGTTLTGCACYSPWIKCENAHANGNECIAYNRGGGAGVFAKAQCVSGFQTTTHRRTGGHGTTNSNSACADDEYVVGCQCSSAWQGCGGMGKRNEMLGSHSCQAYGDNTWADAMCAKVPARAIMKEVTSGKTGSGDDNTAYVTCPSTHPTMTSCACDRETCDGAYIQKVSGTDRCHAYNASGQSGVKAKAICVVGTYTTSQVSGSQSGGNDDDQSKVTCPSGTTLTGCACYSPWIKCENAHANGNECIAYNRGGGAGVFAKAQCVSGFQTTTHRRTGGHGTTNAQANCNSDEYVVGCQCSSAWQGCGGEWKRNEVNGHTCQVYGSNTWADAMCAKVTEP